MDAKIYKAPQSFDGTREMIVPLSILCFIGLTFLLVRSIENRGFSVESIGSILALFLLLIGYSFKNFSTCSYVAIRGNAIEFRSLLNKIVVTPLEIVKIVIVTNKPGQYLLGNSMKNKKKLRMNLVIENMDGFIEQIKSLTPSIEIQEVL